MNAKLLANLNYSDLKLIRMLSGLVSVDSFLMLAVNSMTTFLFKKI